MIIVQIELCCGAGTLTENRMTVVAGWFAGQFYPQPPALDEMPKELQSAIEINSSMNSKVSWPILLCWNTLHVLAEWSPIAEHVRWTVHGLTV